MKKPNKIGGANRRPASPINAEHQFESALCAPPLRSAAVAGVGHKQGARRLPEWVVTFRQHETD